MALVNIVISIAILAVGARACGMVTHNLIAERARMWFVDAEAPHSRLVEQHLPSLQGGAPFPVPAALAAHARTICTSAGQTTTLVRRHTGMLCRRRSPQAALPGRGREVYSRQVSAAVVRGRAAARGFHAWGDLALHCWCAGLHGAHTQTSTGMVLPKCRLGRAFFARWEGW